MRALLGAALVALAMAVPAEAAELPGVHLGNIDNLRFGLTSFQDAPTAALFAGRDGISVGCDYDLGRGLAIGFDSVNLYKDFDGMAYFLSVNPLQLKYRVGLPLGNAPRFQPYASLGGGLAVMGLFGSVPKAAVGYAGSAALGVMIDRGLTLEIGYGGGRAGGVTDYGMHLRFGTAFKSLGLVDAF